MGSMLSTHSRRLSRSARLSGLAVLLVVLAFAPASSAAPGDFDPNFGVGGKQTTDFGGDEDARDIAVQPDGKIVVTGVRYIEADGYESTVARYNVDGSLDSSFSGDGVAEFESGVATAAALQLDGRIVMVGYVGAGDFKVVRYNADGSLDTTFSDDGRQTTDFGGEESVAGVALQADGKILVVGDTGDDRDFAIARYNPDGSLDATFSDDGLATTDFGSPDEFGAGVAVLGNGTIVAVGSSGLPSHFAVVRYNADGSLDTTFSGDGKQITDLGGGEEASDVVLQGDGKIVVLGDNEGEFLLVRYDGDGSLDATFAGDGKQATGFDSVEAFARGVALQADGKLVAVGRSDQDFALARYNADGSLDATFSGDGRQALDFSGGFDMASAAAIQADGKIVAVGQSSDDFALARFEASASTSLDIVPPETTITAGPTGVMANQTPTFAFASSEPGSTFECRVDGGAFTPCISPHSVGTLSAGAHTFEVRAIDSAGNSDPTPAGQSFVVEAMSPPSPPPGGDPQPPQAQPAPANDQPKTTGPKVVPRITNLRLSDKTITTRQRPVLSFRLSSAGRVTVSVLKRKAGVRNGKRCVKPSKQAKGKRCDRQVVRVGRSLGAGVHKLKLPKLKKGRYRVALRLQGAKNVRGGLLIRVS